jgi:imidazolonepropionase
MSLLLVNIAELYIMSEAPTGVIKGKDMSSPFCLKEAWLYIQDGKISDYGTMDSPHYHPVQEVVDCTNRVVFPGFVDSHTHIVFAKTREEEFVMKLKGMSYEQIALNGGGILNSAQKLAETSEDELVESALLRLHEILQTGTTTVEIKTGYGLDVENELKMLRVIARLKNLAPQRIFTTLLAAHALPKTYKENRTAYIDLICNELIPKSVELHKPDFIDVFCETGFFTPEETIRILETGASFGIKGKVHANELDYSGGVQAGCAVQAMSVDHLECVGESELQVLSQSHTVPVLLPATAFFLHIPFAPARKMIDYGLGIALASDFNPGTSPTGNMPLVMSIACLQMRMLPEECLCASTTNAAAALGAEKICGSLAKGMPADLVVTKPIQNLYKIPYHFGTHQISSVMIQGDWQVKENWED